MLGGMAAKPMPGRPDIMGHAQNEARPLEYPQAYFD
jgi:hypothetical protein